MSDDARLLAVSDLHVAYPQNRQLVGELRPRSPGDWLLVAGDVGERLPDIEWALRTLSEHFARVVATDPYVIDDRLVTLDCVMQESDILILGAPHESYRGLRVGGKDVVDVWGALGAGIRL